MNNNIDSLLYDLIFSEKTDFEINIRLYVDEPFVFEWFIDDITLALSRASIKIIEYKIIVDDNKTIWKIKLFR